MRDRIQRAVMIGLHIVVITASGACLPPLAYVACGGECPDGYSCLPDNLTCLKSGCGNGVVESGEECDDGNRENGDGCDNDCTRTHLSGMFQFTTGTLVIPLDRQANEADVLPSYGLVYDLLSNNVPVQWAIKGNKSAATDIDVQIDDGAGVAVSDFKDGTAIQLPVQYTGSAFLIGASDAVAATPRIQAWQAAHPETVVHTVTGTFTAYILKTLTAAPNVAVFDDGNPNIATAVFNAAGIPDSNGDAWLANSPDILSTTDVAGLETSLTDGALHNDGALWNKDGTPRYCQLFSMHYNDGTDQESNPIPAHTTDEVVAEVRSWLKGAKGNHAFMQCKAVTVFENNVSGHFLSTAGLKDDEDAAATSNPAPGPLVDEVPSEPVIQVHGMLTGVSGRVASFGPSSGSQRRAGAQVVVDGLPTSENGQGWWLLKGRLDDDAASGRVTYLGGHNYLPSPSTPTDASNQPNGAKVMLNSLFDAGCATSTSPDSGQPAITLTKSGPATVTGDEILYTIHYANIGNGVAQSTTISDPLPAGTTFVSASNSGSDPGHAGTVIWNLGNLQPGASGDLTLTVHVTSGGTYTNQARGAFLIGNTPKSVESNLVTTTATL